MTDPATTRRHSPICTIIFALLLAASAGAADDRLAAQELEEAGLELADGTAAPPDAGLWPVTSDVVRRATMVIREGDTPSGAAGPITALNSPFTSGDGVVAFTGTAAGDGFVWIGTDIVWLNSDAVGVTLTGGESTMGLGNSGQFIYSPSLNGEDAVWTHDGFLAVENTQAPGFATGTVSTFHSRPTMTAGGRAYWVSGFNENGGATTEGRTLYTAYPATPNEIQVVLRSDDIVGGLAISRPSGIDFDYQASDDGAHLIAVLLMDTGSSLDDDVLFVDGALVVRESMPTGDSDNWDNFDSVSINDDGDYVFSGDTDGDTTTDEFVAFNGAIAIREGDTIDGIALTATAAVRALSLNNRGEAAYTWQTGLGEEHLFIAHDASDLASTSILVLSTGDLVDLDGDGLSDATVLDLEANNGIGPGLSLAENARLFVGVELDDGMTQLDAILALDVPLILFGDGFETGGTDAWSAAVP
jgi:hypothetical protein